MNLKVRRNELLAELGKAQATIRTLQASAQRITGAIALVDELLAEEQAAPAPAPAPAPKLVPSPADEAPCEE
jgi:hypothetical protein